MLFDGDICAAENKKQKRGMRRLRWVESVESLNMAVRKAPGSHLNEDVKEMSEGPVRVSEERLRQAEEQRMECSWTWQEHPAMFKEPWKGQCVCSTVSDREKVGARSQRWRAAPWDSKDGRPLYHPGGRGWFVLGEVGSCRSLEKELNSACVHIRKDLRMDWMGV